MSLSATQQKVQYTSNGSQTSLSIPFVFSLTTDIEVYYGDTKKTLNTDYALVIITGGGVLVWTGGGGTGAVPANGTLVTIKRVVPLTQLATYVNNDEFPAATHEAALDKITEALQQLQEQVNRCIQIPPSNTTTTQLPSAASRANKVLAFDGSGNVIVQ